LRVALCHEEREASDHGRPAMNFSNELMAGISFSGIAFDALGGLYLAYDLLGGKHGPLRTLTRIVTYSALFGLAYGLVLGFRFGLIAGPGLGTALGLQFDRLAHGSDKPSFRFWALLAALRSFSVGLATWYAFSHALGLAFGGFLFLVLLSMWFLKLQPNAFYLQDTRPEFNRRKLLLVGFLGIATALVCMLSSIIAAGSTDLIAFGLRVGITVGLTSGFVLAVSPMIEWWAEHLPERRLGAAGAVLFMIGFCIQAFPYLTVLLDLRG